MIIYIGVYSVVAVLCGNATKLGTERDLVCDNQRSLVKYTVNFYTLLLKIRVLKLLKQKFLF